MLRNKKFDFLMIFIALMAVIVIALIIAVKIKQGSTKNVIEETPKVEEQVETEVETEPVEEPVVEEEAEPVIPMIQTTDLVNVRAEASTEGAKLVTVDAGTQFQLVEQMENGWTKIIYQNQEAYIKSDYVILITPVPAETP